MKSPAGFAAVTQCEVLKKGSGRGDEHHDNDELDGNDDVIDPRRLVDSDDQQSRHRGDDRHRRNIDERAGRMPDPLRRIIGQRRSGQGGRHRNAEILEEAHDIARPSDRHRGGAKRIFEDQVPADDPGDDLSHRRIGVGVGTAGDRNGRGHFRITQTREGAGGRAEDEGHRDGRPGVGRGGVPGQHKNARPDDGADAQGDEIGGREAALERHAVVRGQTLRVWLRRLGLQRGNRFARQNLRHGHRPMQRAAKQTRCETQCGEPRAQP